MPVTESTSEKSVIFRVTVTVSFVLKVDTPSNEIFGAVVSDTVKALSSSVLLPELSVVTALKVCSPMPTL